jgi:hypothetical protein
MDLEKVAKKEIERMEVVFSSIEATEEGRELLDLARAYWEDAKYFYEKKKFLEAFEAAVIAWAYVDAGLHCKLFRIPKRLKRMFTA